MSTVTPRKDTDAATQALWRVAETDNTQRVESILADGADINATNAHGMTALMRAASHGHVQMVRSLLKHGANPNMERNDKFTPLMLAAFFGHEEVVRVLVAHGANTGAATRSGTSAQMWASARTFPDVVDYLSNPAGKPPAARQSAVQAQLERSALSIDSDRDESLTAPPPRVELPFENEWRIVIAESSTLADPVTTPNEIPDVEEALPQFVLRPSLISRLQPLNRRRVVFSLATLLLAMAMIAGLTVREERLTEVSSQNHPPMAIASVATTPAVTNSGEAETTSPFQAPVETLGNDLSNLYKRPESVTVENKPEAPLVIRSIVSKTDSRKSKLSEEQNRSANVNPPDPIPADRVEDVPIREVPTVAVSTTKPQPSVPQAATLRNGPDPTTTDLVSPSKMSPPKGRTIQWP